ncbi:MAG: PAS domain-containing protein [Rhodovibrio sp.]|nr:PAS domain-containing protein [Rhodovibrio sp.]
MQVWRKLCGTRFAPTRQEIAPAEFRQMLGRLALVDVVAGETGTKRYRYRLMGTRLAAQDAVDLTGKRLSDHPNTDVRPVVQAAFDEAVASGRPVYREDVRQDGNRRHSYARLVLPLSEDGQNVTGLLLGRVVLGRAD